jgi:hypothetical protein
MSGTLVQIHCCLPLRQLEAGRFIKSSLPTHRAPGTRRPPEETVFSMTPLFDQVQGALKFSLADLARTDPTNRIMASPLFRRQIEKKSSPDIFVLMPFAQELSVVYEDHLKKVADKLKLTIARADDFFTAEEIMPEVWAAICESRLLVADCTGRNPNVFYEIGPAHALGQCVILITHPPNQFHAFPVNFHLPSLHYFGKLLGHLLQVFLDVLIIPGWMEVARKMDTFNS